MAKGGKQHGLQWCEAEAVNQISSSCWFFQPKSPHDTTCYPDKVTTTYGQCILLIPPICQPWPRIPVGWRQYFFFRNPTCIQCWGIGSCKLLNGRSRKAIRSAFAPPTASSWFPQSPWRHSAVLHFLAFSNQTLHRQALQFSREPNHTNLLPHRSQVGSARITALQFSSEPNCTNLLPHRSQIGSARIT